MSEPTDHADPISGARFELSAMSALHMFAQPIPVEEQDPEDGFLSETDAWAKHSIEHMKQVRKEIEKIRQNSEQLKFYRYKVLRMLADDSKSDAHKLELIKRVLSTSWDRELGHYE